MLMNRRAIGFASTNVVAASVRTTTNALMLELMTADHKPSFLVEARIGNSGKGHGAAA
jgi:hypothetical protein